jgi:hypothetical protein
MPTKRLPVSVRRCVILGGWAFPVFVGIPPCVSDMTWERMRIVSVKAFLSSAYGI